MARTDRTRQAGGVPEKRPKAKNAGKTMKRLLSYIFSEYRGRFIIVLFCILLTALSSAATAIFLKTLVDDYIKPMLSTGSNLFPELLKAMGFLAIVYVVGILANFTHQRLMVGISQGTLKRIRDEMFNHMQDLPVKYFDTHSHGDVMSHYTNDTDTLEQMISQSIPQLISSAATLTVVVISMFALSFWMTLIVFAFIALKLFIAGKVGGNSARYFVAQQRSIAKVNGYVEEMINGQKVVKVFCHEEKCKQDFDKLNEELFGHMSKAHTFGNILMPILGNLGHLLYIVLAIVGGVLALSGVAGLTLGTIVSFLQLSKSINMPINQASQQINSIVMALAGAERIFELIDEEPESDNGYVTLVNAAYDEHGELTESEKRTGTWAWKHPHHDGTTTYTLLRGDVRFYDVDFGYREDKLVLHNISLYAKPGQKLAFVGHTGAGKTTITNLINRFYDLADGKIRFDDININKIKKPDLRRASGVVLQDVNLFTGTIMDNIRYGKLDASDEDCIEAAKEANAHDFIMRLPNGYDTMVEEGGLSQGQRQLISIARAAVSDPPVMILDEATSSVDTRTEAIIQRGMDKLMEGRTVFVIAHRLSTVQNSDAIIVLDHGRIIERGTHEQLIELKGAYYSLYTGAFELE